MMTILALLIGIVLSVALVIVARTKTLEVEMRIYAFGLAVAAFIYVIFGVFGGADAKWLTLEVLGVFIYGFAAWSGLRWNVFLLAFGWGTHVAWDVLLHLWETGAEYTPVWYPWLCLSFDVILTGAVLARSKHTANAHY